MSTFLGKRTAETRQKFCGTKKGIKVNPFFPQTVEIKNSCRKGWNIKTKRRRHYDGSWVLIECVAKKRGGQWGWGFRKKDAPNCAKTICNMCACVLCPIRVAAAVTWRTAGWRKQKFPPTDWNFFIYSKVWVIESHCPEFCPLPQKMLIISLGAFFN